MRRNTAVVQDPLWDASRPVSAGSGETSPVPGRAPVVCLACDARIGSERGCHCPSCHESFADIDVFDAHRRHGRCVDLSRAGFVRMDRGGWSRWVKADAS